MHSSPAFLGWSRVVCRRRRQEATASLFGLYWTMRFLTGLMSLMMMAAVSVRGSLAPVPWPATDGLGRSLPMASETGGPRPDRTVALFYFLWLGPHAGAGGPWDVRKILEDDPLAMQKPDSPRWGPLHAPHHWGESIFGYYTTDDAYVLRKHAQMLSDAGVDTVVFDVTNQLTYRASYMALLKTWSAVRAEGGRTPQVAFLCPFWQPATVVRELWRELYEPGLHRDLWFQWDGKPLILADPARLATDVVSMSFDEQAVVLAPGGDGAGDGAGVLAQTFTADREWAAVAARIPTWGTSDGAASLTLRRGGPTGEVVATRRLERLVDNDWVRLSLPGLEAAGAFCLELSDGSGRVGWWSSPVSVIPGGQALVNGVAVAGGRSLRVEYADPAVELIRDFFSFRSPQPDYFRGPERPDMWSWLEVFPQHAFFNARGEKEQMSVGVGQNAVGRRLGSMSESAGARGRSFHRGARDQRPGAAALGLNFAEQFEHALREDPRALFITGWNEWIAGRHDEFAGIREPVMFVDQFDHEHSRDIEPMKGGHGDAYYYQLAAAIRRYKGTPALPEVMAEAPISVAGDFAQWKAVPGSLADDVGDTAHRSHPGYAGHTQYVNTSGRNDIVEAKTAGQGGQLAFYVRTRETLSPSSEPGWMWLLLDADANPATGWEGYDLMVNRTPPSNGRATVEKNTGGWNWEIVGSAPIRWEGVHLHLELPRALLTIDGASGRYFDFKWADHMPENGDLASWLDAGDCAPNGRFKYRVAAAGPVAGPAEGAKAGSAAGLGGGEAGKTLVNPPARD